MSKATVLLVDDEQPLHTVFVGMLKLDGFDAYAAIDAASGFKEIEQHRPDVIFCDLMMPKVSGLDFLMKCKEDATLSQIPIIMITAYGMDDLVDVARAMGAFDVLAKPFTRQALMELLDAALEGKAS